MVGELAVRAECNRLRSVFVTQAVHHFRARMHFVMAQQYCEEVRALSKPPP